MIMISEPFFIFEIIKLTEYASSLLFFFFLNDFLSEHMINFPAFFTAENRASASVRNIGLDSCRRPDLIKQVYLLVALS